MPPDDRRQPRQVPYAPTTAVAGAAQAATTDARSTLAKSPQHPLSPTDAEGHMREEGCERG